MPGCDHPKSLGGSKEASMQTIRTVFFALMVVALLVSAVSPAGAEPRGPAVTVSGMGGYTLLSTDTDLSVAPYVGARLGFMLNQYFGIEGSWGYTRSKFDVSGDEDVPIKTYGADLLINIIPEGGVNPFLIAGWAQQDVRPDVPSTHPEYSSQDRHFNGWEAGLGLKIKLWGSGSTRGSLRLEGRDVYAKWDGFAVTGDSWQHTIYATGGITLDWGPNSDKDSDGDGVPDKKDQCPGTPRGARVDAVGCPLDGDGDGVPDGIDICPGTPGGAKVDDKGCPIDSDGDSVPDGIDKCPDTPKGAQVDAVGCPIDSDGDGVPDGIDTCPNTPQGAQVDAVGCPIDSDGDGVPDGIDECPDTPADTLVDPKGCPLPEEAKELLDTGSLIMRDIQFQTNSATLKPTSYPALEKVGQILAAWPELKLEVAGYTDNTGNVNYNKELSLKRAQSVADYIENLYPSIGADQMTVAGYGVEFPIATNDTAEGRSKNRRVEFKVLSQGTLEKK